MCAKYACTCSCEYHEIMHITGVKKNSNASINNNNKTQTYDSK